MSDDLEAMFNALDDDMHNTREDYVYSALNYMGSKTSSLDGIIPYLPNTDKFIDVFGGSGVITLAKKRSKFEVYNDRHSGLIAFYRSIQNEDTFHRMVDLIKLMPHSREMFLYNKKTWEQDQDPVVRGAKFYYLVQAAFAGRAEAFGRDLKERNTVWRKIHENLELFPLIHERFKGVLVENLDWRQCLKDFDGPDACFYLDPPYVQSNVYQHGMSLKDHIEMCERIFQVEGFVALSGYENPIYDKFPWNDIKQVVVNGRVATMSFDPNNNMRGFEGTVERKDRIEYLWIKELC